LRGGFDTREVEWTPVQDVAECALDVLETRLSLWFPIIHGALERKSEYFSMNAAIVQSETRRGKGGQGRWAMEKLAF